jgi:hypothetical protein
MRVFSPSIGYKIHMALLVFNRKKRGTTLGSIAPISRVTGQHGRRAPDF